MVDPSINLIYGTHDFCERREYAFNVLPKYSIITLSKDPNSTWVFLDSHKWAHHTVVSSSYSVPSSLAFVHNFNQIMKKIMYGSLFCGNLNLVDKDREKNSRFFFQSTLKEKYLKQSFHG
jgi:hypothetical protein